MPACFRNDVGNILLGVGWGGRSPPTLKADNAPDLPPHTRSRLYPRCLDCHTLLLVRPGTLFPVGPNFSHHKARVLAVGWTPCWGPEKTGTATPPPNTPSSAPPPSLKVGSRGARWRTRQSGARPDQGWAPTVEGECDSPPMTANLVQAPGYLNLTSTSTSTWHALPPSCLDFCSYVDCIQFIGCCMTLPHHSPTPPICASPSLPRSCTSCKPRQRPLPTANALLQEAAIGRATGQRGQQRQPKYNYWRSVTGAQCRGLPPLFTPNPKLTSVPTPARTPSPLPAAPVRPDSHRHPSGAPSGIRGAACAGQPLHCHTKCPHCPHVHARTVTPAPPPTLTGACLANSEGSCPPPSGPDTEQ